MDSAIKSSVYVHSPDHAGWLMKKGFQWRKLWKKRWVSLHGMELSYMEQEPNASNLSKMTITKAHLSGASIVTEEDPDAGDDPAGFAIHLNDGKSPVWYLRAENEHQRKLWVLRISYALTIVKWLDDFEKVRVLGVGGTGIVSELLHKSSKQRFAMKEMEIKSTYQRQMAMSEAEMLKEMSENVHHPNILQIERVFQVGSKFYLVFPLCTGGELYEYIIKRGSFTEHDAASLIREIISGLQALHQHDILHLDIKPENILFESCEDKATLKITDFGLSRKFSMAEENAFNKELVREKIQKEKNSYEKSGELPNERKLKGTIGYMSPELMLIGHISRATDMFACGVVVYILLSGIPPFQGANDQESINKTINGTYSFTHEVWDRISVDAKDFVRRMLEVDPFQRITFEQLLEHPWLQKVDETNVVSPITSVAEPSQKDLNKLPDINLAGTIRELTGYIKQQRTEKLAMNMTRLVSMMQRADVDGGKSSLADIYLATTSTSSSKQNINSKAKETVSDENHIMLMNSDLRNAFSRVIVQLTTGTTIAGRDSIVVDDSSSVSRSSSSSPVKGRDILPIDQFGFTVEQFVMILSYFVFNSVNPTAAADSSVKNHFSLLVYSRFLDRDGDGFITMDDISTAQAMMLQRSDSLVKMFFRIYAEILWYPGKQINIINMVQSGGTNTIQENNNNVILSNDRVSSGLPKDLFEPPKYITGKNVAAVFEKLGYDSACGHKVFVVLCEALIRIDGTTLETTTSSTNKDYSSNLDYYPISPISTTTNYLKSFSPAKPILKMDVKAFIRACEIDDVLLQAVWRRPRSCIKDIIERAHEIAVASDYQKSIVDVLEAELLAVLKPVIRTSCSNSSSILVTRRSSLGETISKTINGFI